MVETENFKEKKRFESLIEDFNRNSVAIIVEGYRDKMVLENLGFEGKVFLSAERKNEDLCEDVARGSEKVVILTDFDSHGRDQNRKIRKLLEGKTDVINSFRKEMKVKMARNDRYAIEDIRPVLEDKKKKFVEEKLDEISYEADTRTQ